ncbi:MAG TPA: two-component regulator propeller domain-containing protein [Chitinophagales bacterium]|nr:two-component regulator propeller domain-containing protein [Chitinophagales bacterium]
MKIFKKQSSEWFMKKTLLLLILFLQCQIASAQDDLVCTRYSHVDGLPAAFANAGMLTDEAGLLWLFTEQSIVRYDGCVFKTYPNKDAKVWGKAIRTDTWAMIGGFERFYVQRDSDLYVYHPLINGFDRYDFSKLITGSEKKILVTIDDSKNHCIWVITQRELFKLSYFSGNIKRWNAPVSEGNKYLIPGNKIIYNAWGDSLLVFDIETEKFETEYLGGAKDLSPARIEYFTEKNTPEGRELISTAILSKDGKRIFWFRQKSPLQPKIIETPSLLTTAIVPYPSMTFADADNLWIWKGEEHVMHLNLSAGKMDTPDVKIPLHFDPKGGAGGLMMDGDGELWLGYEDQGLLRVNPAKKTVTQYLSISGNPNSIWSNHVRFPICRSSGVLWVNESPFGLTKIEKKRNLFSTIAQLPDEYSNSIRNFDALNTRMLLPLDSDHLLSGTLANISNVDIRTGKVNVVRYPDNSVVKELTANHWWGCAVADARGNIIIGTWDAWIFVYNNHSKTCRSFHALPGGPAPGQAYRTMLLDSKNMLWIGGRHGVYRIKENEILSNPSPHLQWLGTGDSTTVQTVFCFMEDRNKNMWVGSMGGIKVFSPDGKITSYTHEDGRNSLSLNEVRCIAEDSTGNIWIATCGGGLNKLDVSTHQFSAYTTKDGLADDVIYSMLIDKENNLWLASDLGVTKFNPSNGSVNNFTPFDGLQGYEFNTNASCIMPGGELVFGGTSGLSFFNPEAIAVSSSVPIVMLSSFKVLGEETSLDTGVTRLSYKQDNLTFQFATTSYYRSSENQFAYRLEGLDNDWVYSGNRAYVTYSHVPPGDYTFRVKAANSSGVWNEKGVAYKISVSPPWWATWWFRIAAVLAIASAVYLLYRYQLRHALKLQAIRNRIAGDLHDEIGSTLSSISIYSQVAKKEVMSKAPEAAGMLENITESTTGMMDAMNDIVWMINTRNDHFDNITDRMNAFANELLEAKNCNVHLHISHEMEKLRLDMSQRKNLYLIFKEAINNAAKYAECRNVWIDLSMNGSHTIIMTIRDDGKGFDTTLEPRGNGLLSMQKRSKELKGEFKFSSKAGEGTLVRLEFAL